MILNRVLIAAAVAAAAFASGCASDAPAGGAGEQAATLHEQRCVGLLRDMRLYCQENLSNRQAPMSMDCISRRLEFERACF